MGTIQILSDRDGVYAEGSQISIMRFIQDYLDACPDSGVQGWLTRIPMPSAVAFIADAWGIDYKFV